MIQLQSFRRVRLPGLFALIICCAVSHAFAHRKHTADMGWWKKARFGMFIHWGLYSQAAGYWHGKPVHGAGEWIMTEAHIRRGPYAKLAQHFDPVKFNADAWVRLAKAAGMKYLVITAMHHEGFCMFPTKATHYNIVDDTPWGKDPLAMLDAACHKYGLRFCTYYSVENWHSRYQLPHRWNHGHPTYFPTRFAPGGAKPYLAYMKRQLGELIRQYHPSLIWFDNSVIKSWRTPKGKYVPGWTPADAIEIWDYVRKLDPTVIMNNRLEAWVHLKGYGDYQTPEQFVPRGGYPGPWETCMTINNTWGYKRHDNQWKSARVLILDLIRCAAGGGNFLLNVGPTGKGVIPAPEAARLRTIGAWLKVNGDAIYGSHRSPFGKAKLPFGYATQKPGKLYLEIVHWPRDGHLLLPIKNKVLAAFSLGDTSLHYALKQTSHGPMVILPAQRPSPLPSVVEVQISGAVIPR